VKPKILHKVLSVLMKVWRCLNRLLIWHTLRRTYVDCFVGQLPCPLDAGGTERKRWQEACRIEELRWRLSRPLPKAP